eukprot:TRINITY_DN373_c0_g1_i17.p1 TRINITY_DN373_c0_g1~~TRINITY_DN373_c0_g1_i17.p1  ORF type:complete len:179 (-),score=66.95 TRINITY_DN373_c0_g1_i17:95-631(-)
MIRRPPRSTQSRSSAASDVYKRQCVARHLTSTGEPTIRRGQFATPPKQEGPRVNDQIRVREVRLIGANGENHGVVTTAEAMNIAADSGLDLVEISPNAEPPVCKVLDYGKFKYEQQKKANAARKNQKTQEVKEIKMRPGIDVHDYQTCLLYTSDAADDLLCVDLGGRRIIKKKKKKKK